MSARGDFFWDEVAGERIVREIDGLEIRIRALGRRGGLVGWLVGLETIRGGTGGIHLGDIVFGSVLWRSLLLTKSAPCGYGADILHSMHGPLGF